MNRRHFLHSALASTLASALPARDSRPRRVLLRSSWQTVNIGDIGHTPGVLALLEKHLPGVEVRLWASDVRHGVREMLQARFPRVPIVQKGADVQRAMRECDFLLHGSGPSLVAHKHVKLWREKTRKPYGVFGITVPAINKEIRDHLTNAAFVFFRDTVSLKLARTKGVKCPVMEFGPDGAFAVDVRNDKAAQAYLRAHGLQSGQFLCCIPRLRYTPYWKIKDRPFDKVKHARNEKMKEHDHAPLRQAICAVVRQTKLKVLLCPEDQTQMAVGKEMLLDRLPRDVKPRVVWREKYWLTDEAVSTYVRSAGLFGLEMHSPIMCVGNGIPAIVCRFREQTSKGFMWRDIGLGDWLFDMDNPRDVARIVPAVLSLAQKPAVAREKAAQAQKRVARLQRGMVQQLGKSLGPEGKGERGE